MNMEWPLVSTRLLTSAGMTEVPEVNIRWSAGVNVDSGEETQPDVSLASLVRGD